LLRLEGKGFHRIEVVKELSTKFGVTEQTIYNDYASRQEWQPKLSDLTDSNVLMKIANRYDQIYRDLSFKALETKNESVWLGCQNDKIKINQLMAETLLGIGTNKKVELTQTQPFIIEMWRPEVGNTKPKQ